MVFGGSREPSLLIFTTHLQLSSAHLQLSSEHFLSAFCTSTAARLASSYLHLALCIVHFDVGSSSVHQQSTVPVGFFCISLPHPLRKVMKLLNQLNVWACSDHEELVFECKLEKLSLEIQSKNCKLFGVNHHF